MPVLVWPCFTRSLTTVSLEELLSPAGIMHFCFRVRLLTSPVATHLSLAGLFAPYPGHEMPLEVHLLHSGNEESQTKSLCRHSQQCLFLWSPLSDIEAHAKRIRNLKSKRFSHCASNKYQIRVVYRCLQLTNGSVP